MFTDNRNKIEDFSQNLHALWSYLSSWLSSDGGVNGPVVHRCDLKRMFAIHDTPWTQGPIIEGLVHLYRRSGEHYWLDMAKTLADAQCRRLQKDGSYKWAGHEDDRYSSLVHNALADCGILSVAEVLKQKDEDEARLSFYIATVEANVKQHLLGCLFDESIGGFMMNVPTRTLSESITGRFITNMNSVAVEAMLRLDSLRNLDEYMELSLRIGREILLLQLDSGKDKGAFGYSKTQLHCCITIYTALTLRGLPYLYRISGDAVYLQATKRAVSHLATMRDSESGLWYHKIEDGSLAKYPLFVSGAGMICNGILDAAELTGHPVDTKKMVNDILIHQLPNGGISNFIGYDHPDNGRIHGIGKVCWEDIVPTPNWNAHSFLFLSRVSNVPLSEVISSSGYNVILKKSFFYIENKYFSFIGCYRPLRSAGICGYVKKRPYGFYLSIFSIIYILYNYSGLRFLRRQ